MYINFPDLRIISILLSLLSFNYFLSQDFVKLRNPLEGDPGFFLDDWEEKRNPKISYSKSILHTKNETTVNAIVDFSKPLVKISKYIFGNNLGHWSNRKILSNDDFIFNLKDISIPVIRFPVEMHQTITFGTLVQLISVLKELHQLFTNLILRRPHLLS